jgi:hypothetical protein
MDMMDTVEGLPTPRALFHPGDIEDDAVLESRSGLTTGIGTSNYGQLVPHLTHNRSIGLSFLRMRSTVTQSGASTQLFYPSIMGPISSHSELNVCLHYLYLVYNILTK